MAETNALLPVVRLYVEKDPAAAARMLERLDEAQSADLAKALPSSLTALILPNLQVSYAAALLRDVQPADFKEILRGIDPKRAATIFMHLPEDVRERLQQHVPRKVLLHLQELVTYPQNSVGRIMTTDFLTFRRDVTVRDAIKRMRARAQRGAPPSYAYIVEDEDRLAGVLTMHDLLLAQSDVPLESLMKKGVFSLHCFTDLETAANELSKRRYFAVPVVDNENRLLGVLKAQNLLHGVQEDVVQHVQRMFGAGGDERVFSPVIFSIRKRLPWLHVNLVTAFLAAAVVGLFEDIIGQVTALAVLLPVVAGQGGNAGAQSLAIVMRGLVMREVPAGRKLQLVLKEGLLGAVNGAVVGLVTGVIVWLWYQNQALGLVICLGMLVNLISAGLAGASIPLILKSIGLDPAQCSSIVLTTITDVVGFFAFLGFALAVKQHLVA